MTAEALARPEHLTVWNAAQRRGTTPYSVLVAIALGELRAGQVRGRVVVRDDEHFARWTPPARRAATAA